MPAPAIPDDAATEQVSHRDVGLVADAHTPFRFTPATTWSPLVLSFPHVGLRWPRELGHKPQADFAANADYQVQQLYRGVQRMGVATLEAVFSRLVVDLNRADDDISPRVVPDHPAPRPRARPGFPEDHSTAPPRPGRGVVWTRAIGDVVLLREPLPYAAFERRLDRFHRPYYRALQVLLERRRARFGYAVLLDAHSMPGSVGVDLVLGTLDGASCDHRLVASAVRALGDQPHETGLSVRRDRPYRGGEIVRRFGRPADGYHALQLEVRRSLYMDEQTHRLRPRPDPTNGTSGAQGPEQALASLLRRLNSLVEALASEVEVLSRGMSAEPPAGAGAS